MKKKILFLIVLLVPFLVNAQEELSYGWDYLNEDGALFIAEKDNEYLVGENMPFIKKVNQAKMSVPDPKISYFSPSGKKLRSIKIDDLSESQLDEIENLYKEKSLMSHVEYAVGEEYVGIWPEYNEVYVCPNEEAFREEDDTCVLYAYDELSDSEVEKYVGSYSAMFDIVNRYNSSEIGFRKIGNLFLVQRFDYSNNNSYSEVYDINGKRLVSEKNQLPSKIAIMDANLYGIYVVTQELDFHEKTTTYELTKYDLTGKKEYTIDLNDMIIENNTQDIEDMYYFIINQVAVVNGGLVLNFGTNYYETEINECVAYYENPNLSDEEISNINPDYIDADGNIDAQGLCEEYVLGASIGGIDIVKGNNSKKILKGYVNKEDYLPFNPVLLVKLNLDYEVATKIDGKGNVKVINRSGAGEGVTFVVEPAKGYVLGVVKVTDALGNVIEFHDYTFTMPSSDVLIEVEFVKENPNTADIAIVTIISLAIVFGIVLLNVNKKYRWLK